MAVHGMEKATQTRMANANSQPVNHRWRKSFATEMAHVGAPKQRRMALRPSTTSC